MTPRRVPTAVAIALTLLGIVPTSAIAQDRITVVSVHVLDTGPGGLGRGPLLLDPLETRIVSGDYPGADPLAPVPLPGGGEALWVESQLDPQRTVGNEAANAEWVRLQVKSDQPCARMMHISGHRMAYVNGEPRGGDDYNLGFVRHPVALRAGDNEVLVRTGRGRVRVEFTVPPAPVFISADDATLPDLVVGQTADAWFGVVVVNATANDLTTGLISANGRTWPLPRVPAMSARKVAVRLIEPARDRAGEVPLSVSVIPLGDGAAWAPFERTFTLRVREPHERRVRTYLSSVEGSVQEYGVVPRAGNDHADAGGLILTLHGASVDVRSQAGAFEPKDWATVIAPSNRRPFGFDWEDWGRIDAFEALADARAHFNPDPARVWLTGHSMGGHGALHIGLTAPGVFAAVAPAAGWRSFWTYGGAWNPRENSGAPARLLRRAMNTSDPLLVIENGAGIPFHVLQGDADDTVPVEEARAIRDALLGAGIDIEYHEAPGMGHWWGRAADEVTQNAFFQRHTLPDRAGTDTVRLATTNPAVSSEHHWLRVITQERSLEVSRARFTLDRAAREFRGTAENVRRFALDLSVLQGEGAARVVLDGAKPETIELTPDQASAGRTVFENTGTGWRTASGENPQEKNPARAGPFKRAFGNGVVLVYGTGGGEAEAARLRNLARFYAEVFAYRGNGSLVYLADTQFDAAAHSGRNVVLLGNADTNRQWASLLPRCPVKVEAGKATIGDRAIEGDNLCVLLCYPRAGDDRALVGAIASTGEAGTRLATRLPIFLSGVAYPDVTVMDARVLLGDDAGFIAAGFFNADWTIGDDFAFAP